MGRVGGSPARLCNSSHHSRPRVRCITRREKVRCTHLLPCGWLDIEEVPEADGFSEDLVTLILGSRTPILFVEGQQGSLDLAFYRACYPDWTVVPRGGCEAVIHSVVKMRRNAAFTRIHCAGLVDADGHSESDRVNLASNGVRVLPVSEIENLLLVPSVSRAILEMNDLGDEEVEKKLLDLRAAVFADAAIEKNLNEVVLGHCRRRIDRMLKQVDLTTGSTIGDLASVYSAKTSEVDVPRSLANWRLRSRSLWRPTISSSCWRSGIARRHYSRSRPPTSAIGR